MSGEGTFKTRNPSVPRLDRQEELIRRLKNIIVKNSFISFY